MTESRHKLTVTIPARRRWIMAVAGSVLVVALGVTATLVALGNGSAGQATDDAGANVDAAASVTPTAPVVGPATTAPPSRTPTFNKAPGLTKQLARRTQREARRKAHSKAAIAQATPDFTVATYNVLGSQHTRGSHRYAPGPVRTARGTALLLRNGVSIVGFDEMQRDQLAAFEHNAPTFATYPGDTIGSAGVPTTIAWNTKVWTLVHGETYDIGFEHQTRPQPIVLLKNNVSGQQIIVMNIHNSPQGQQASRNAATAIELKQMQQMLTYGLPVVLTGDFNEKVEAFCTWTDHTVLESAVGGSSSDGHCDPPPHPRVDWIFTSPSLNTLSYTVTRASPVPSITDHALLWTKLSVG